MREEDEVPRRRRVRFGFSFVRGRVFSKARLDRAVLGLLLQWRGGLDGGDEVRREGRENWLTFVAACWSGARR